MKRSTHIIGRTLARTILSALLFGLAVGPVLAGRLVDAATQAEKLAGDGKAREAFETMREAFGDFSVTLPFAIGEASFVAEKPTAYGAFKARENSTFKPGEPLITYVELIGLAWKVLDDGQFQSHFTVDLEVLDARGDRLAAQEGFGNFTFTGHVRNQELYTHLTLDLSGASPGDYTLRYTVKDTTTGKTAVVQQPFTLAAE